MKINFFLFILSILLFSPSLYASHSITFNVGGFIGRYKIDTGPVNIGNKVLSLSAGSHTFNIELGGSTTFTVNGDGTVSTADSTILSYSGSTITLNTAGVVFDLNGYNYIFVISISSFQTATGTYYLPKNLATSIGIPGTNNLISVTVNQDGFVNVNTGSDKVTGSQNLITFKTIDINIDPKQFDGPYSFEGKPFITGTTAHKLFPNATYTLKTSSGAVLDTFQTNNTQLVEVTKTKSKSIGNTVLFYVNKYDITPPSTYTSAWQLYSQGSNIGSASEWLVIGAQTRLVVGSNIYFTADSTCSSFNVSTTAGSFSFACDAASSFLHNSLSTTQFNPTSGGYILNKTDGRLSVSIGDYALTINGASHPLTDYQLSNDTLHIYDAFVEGRNAIVLDGEDASGNAFQLTPVFWAGSAEIQVATSGPTDTITLDVEHVIGANKYTKSVSKQAVNHLAIFQNVPRLGTGYIYVSSDRGNKKVFHTKIAEQQTVDFR